MFEFGKFIFWFGTVLFIIVSFVVCYFVVVQGNDNPIADVYVVPIATMITGIGMAYFSKPKAS